MTLSREQSRIWQAMNVGAQWILRTSEDPLLPEKAPQAPAHKAAQTPAAEAAARTRPHAALRPAVRTGAETRPQATPRAPQAAARPSLKPVPGAAAAPAAAPLRPAAGSQAAQAPRAVPDAALVAEVRTAPWERIASIVNRCRACMMADTRQHTVCADGAPGCPMVLIGEAPGRDEDLQGIPFVGKSGALLNKILEACGLQRGRDVAIVNVLKCRPPRNRDPRPDEAAACAAFLDRQLELLAPSVIVLMGRQATLRMLNRTERLDALRGKIWKLSIAGREVPVVVTYHPSSLLRNPGDKEKGWHDFLFARDILQHGAGAAAG